VTKYRIPSGRQKLAMKGREKSLKKWKTKTGYERKGKSLKNW
jgi:hypothetical protein